ncbi:MAG: DUF4404 family protein [Anaerolineae bacterium]
MDDKNKGTLKSLRHKLSEVTPANPKVKAQIELLNNELDQFVSMPNPEDSGSIPALQIALQNAIESFEDHHPDLTEAIRIAINTLVNAGI